MKESDKGRVVRLSNENAILKRLVIELVHNRIHLHSDRVSKLMAAAKSACTSMSEAMVSIQAIMNTPEPAVLPNWQTVEEYLQTNRFVAPSLLPSDAPRSKRSKR